MTYYRGTKVIASIGVNPNVANETIISELPPTNRRNGGDLRSGDRWYNSLTSIESLWTEETSSWNEIRTKGKAVSSSTPPPNPTAGDLWFRDDIGKLYIYYKDENSQQWINVDAS